MQLAEPVRTENAVQDTVVTPGALNLMQQKHIDELQDRLVSPFVRLFIFLNACVYVLIVMAWVGDVVTKPANPIITERVIMTLIGASIVQSGAAILAITRFVFPTLKVSGGQGG